MAEKRDAWQDNKTLIIMVGALVVLIGIVGMGGLAGNIKELNAKIEKQSAQIKDSAQKLDAASKEKAALQAELKKLKETDNYFYQHGVHLRKSGKLAESITVLKDMTLRFPKSPLLADARSLINQNQNDIVKAIYEQAEQFGAKDDFVASKGKILEILEKYPDSPYAYKARVLDAKITERDRVVTAAANEKAARAGSELELITWRWSSEYSYNIAEGQVKNLTDKAMENVAAVFEGHDSQGNFIASNESLISYNPLLPGQTSPFKVMLRENPAIKKGSMSFKYLLGGEIPTYRK